MAETETARAPDGRVLAFCEWGDPAGHPVFYLHGTPGSRFLRSVDGGYERIGVRVITFDRPGYGRSSRLPDRRVRRAADDVRVIADHLGIDELAVVGVSGGGPHALAVAAGLAGRVTRCATVCGVGARDAEDLDFFDAMSPEEVAGWREMSAPDVDAGKVHRETLAWVESLRVGTELPTGTRNMLVEAFTEAVAKGPDGMLDDYAALSSAWGFDLAAVVCPVTIMIAEADTSVPPAHGRWLAKHVQQSRLVSVSGGHLGPREREEEELLSWVGHRRP